LLTAGSQAYLGEPVSIIAHSLQAARLAELDAAFPSLVVATLLHDIGWLLRGGPRSHDLCSPAFLGQHHGSDLAAPLGRLSEEPRGIHAGPWSLPGCRGVGVVEQHLRLRIF